MPKYYAKISGKFELGGFLTAENRVETVDKLKDRGFDENVVDHTLLGEIEILDLVEADEAERP